MTAEDGDGAVAGLIAEDEEEGVAAEGLIVVDVVVVEVDRPTVAGSATSRARRRRSERWLRCPTATSR